MPMSSAVLVAHGEHGAMSNTIRAFLASTVVAALALTGCGGDDDTDATAAEDVETESPTGDPSDGDDGSAEDPADDAGGESADDSDTSGVQHPVISFAASGPGEPNTFGPQCSMGIEATASNLFRVTAPASWTQRGSGGGSGASDLRFEVGDGEVYVDMGATEGELRDVEFGDAAGEADLAGTTAPIVEATLDERTGYAIDGVVWMTGLPDQFGGEEEMTIVVSSADPALPTLEEATAVLSSVRVERCAAIADALVAASADRVLGVPEFVDDPLGKTYPGGDQPALDMAGAVNAWSTDQLAYLLPFPEPVDQCVAESLQDELPSVFPIGMGAVSAVQGTQQDALIAIADAC